MIWLLRKKIKKPRSGAANHLVASEARQSASGASESSFMLDMRASLARSCWVSICVE